MQQTAQSTLPTTSMSVSGSGHGPGPGYSHSGPGSQSAPLQGQGAIGSYVSRANINIQSNPGDAPPGPGPAVTHTCMPLGLPRSARVMCGPSHHWTLGPGCREQRAALRDLPGAGVGGYGSCGARLRGPRLPPPRRLREGSERGIPWLLGGQARGHSGRGGGGAGHRGGRAETGRAAWAEHWGRQAPTATAHQ